MRPKGVVQSKRLLGGPLPLAHSIPSTLRSFHGASVVGGEMSIPPFLFSSQFFLAPRSIDQQQPPHQSFSLNLSLLHIRFETELTYFSEELANPFEFELTYFFSGTVFWLRPKD